MVKRFFPLSFVESTRLSLSRFDRCLLSCKREEIKPQPEPGSDARQFHSSARWQLTKVVLRNLTQDRFLGFAAIYPLSAARMEIAAARRMAGSATSPSSTTGSVESRIGLVPPKGVFGVRVLGLVNNSSVKVLFHQLPTYIRPPGADVLDHAQVVRDENSR